MPTRKAHARWEGDLREGKGNLDVESGAFSSPYSFVSRFESGKGTNPEELLGAAHAGCFSMALSHMLSSAGFKPDYVDTVAHVTIAKQDSGIKITESHLVCEAKVPNIEPSAFLQQAEAAKAGCAVSQALAGTRVTLEAKLVGK